MTITTSTNKVQYVGDGSVSQFSVPFPFFEETDLEVYTQASAAASTELKTMGTHYTITGNGESLTGEVDWTVTPPASGMAILIRRVIPQTQSSDYVNNDIFNAETLEDDLDRAVMRDQQIQEELDRAVKVGPFGSAQVFPDPLDGYFLFWSSGVLANGKQSSLSGVTTTPYTLTLLDDASAGQARQTLGFSPVGSWDVQSGGTLRASAGGTVDLTDGTLLVPQASAASGASGQLQLNGSDLEVDPDGAGFDNVGPRLNWLSTQETIVSQANNSSYAEYTLSVADGTQAVEISWDAYGAANTAKVALQPSYGGAAVTVGVQAAVTGVRDFGSLTLPLDGNKKIKAKKLTGNYYSLWLNGYWR